MKNTILYEIRRQLLHLEIGRSKLSRLAAQMDERKANPPLSDLQQALLLFRVEDLTVQLTELAAKLEADLNNADEPVLPENVAK